MCCGKATIGSVVFFPLLIKVGEELKFSPMFLKLGDAAYLTEKYIIEKHYKKI